MSLSPSELVLDFHKIYGVPVIQKPQFPPEDRRALRLGLLEEEVGELLNAEDSDDLVEVADALADIVYVAFGMAIEYGIDLDAVLAEVHRANLSKLAADGSVLRREDGKVLKGPNYTPPDVASVLARQSV